MNDFYLFSIHINNKDIKNAMLLLRDKPESVARRIMIKAKVSVPSCTGKLFWSWAQKYIIDSCRSPKGNSNERSISNTAPDVSFKYPTVESSVTRYDKACCVSGDAARSLQHAIPVASSPRDVCDRPDGLSTVLPGMGHKHTENARETPAARETSMEVGNNHPTHFLSGVQQTRPVVCGQYSVRFCGRHAAAGVDALTWKKRTSPLRPSYSGKSAIAGASQLRPSGTGTGPFTGNLVVTSFQREEYHSRDVDIRCAADSERCWSHRNTAGKYSALRRIAYGDLTSGHNLSCTETHPQKRHTVHATQLLLRILFWPFTAIWRAHCDLLIRSMPPPVFDALRAWERSDTTAQYCAGFFFSAQK